MHPFNTVGVRMNLATSSGGSSVSFFPYFLETVKTKGFMSLYSGLSAGLTRQLFYATSRLGIFEVMRDEMAKVRPTDLVSRLVTGMASGGK